MAVTTGFVQKLWWLSGGPTACAWVGQDAASASLFFMQVRAGDTEFDIGAKKAKVSALVSAQLEGRQVDVIHGQNSSEIDAVTTILGDVAAADVQMDTIEITQAVQDLALSMPLIANKRTGVR